MATSNQIAYWKMKEDKRHNLAQELLGTKTLEETYRHNVAGEQHNVNVLGETIRSNRSNEYIKLLGHQETVRSNKARETETNRSNLAREVETYRSNLAREQETQRHNINAETIAIADQHNQAIMNRKRIEAQEVIADREARIKWESVQNDINKLLENIRHNQNMEAVEYERLEQLVKQTESEIKRKNYQNARDLMASIESVFKSAQGITSIVTALAGLMG